MFEKVVRWIDRLAIAYLAKRQDAGYQKFIEANPEMELRFHKAEFKQGGFDMTGISESVAIMANEAAKMLKQNHAENYVQFDMIPSLKRDPDEINIRPVRITVQWAYGLSPAEKAAKLEKELKALKVDAGWLFRKTKMLLNYVNEFEQLPDGKLLDSLEETIRSLENRYPDCLAWIDCRDEEKQP